MKSFSLSWHLSILSKCRALSITFMLSVAFQQVSSAQSPILESATLQVTADVWKEFHDHGGVNFSGQLGECDGRQILKLKVINRNTVRTEVRAGFLNGSRRLVSQVFILQSFEEVVIKCSNSQGLPPIILEDGTSVRIETQLFPLN